MRVIEAMAAALALMAVCGVLWAVSYLPTRVIPGHWDIAWLFFVWATLILCLVERKGSQS